MDKVKNRIDNKYENLQSNFLKEKYNDNQLLAVQIVTSMDTNALLYEILEQQKKICILLEQNQALLKN